MQQKQLFSRLEHPPRDWAAWNMGSLVNSKLSSFTWSTFFASVNISEDGVQIQARMSETNHAAWCWICLSISSCGKSQFLIGKHRKSSINAPFSSIFHSKLLNNQRVLTNWWCQSGSTRALLPWHFTAADGKGQLFGRCSCVSGQGCWKIIASGYLT
jgi:hypothetical protein